MAYPNTPYPGWPGPPAPRVTAAVWTLSAAVLLALLALTAWAYGGGP